MGFEQERARQALAANDNSMKAAIAALRRGLTSASPPSHNIEIAED